MLIAWFVWFLYFVCCLFGLVVMFSCYFDCCACLFLIYFVGLFVYCLFGLFCLLFYFACLCLFVCLCTTLNVDFDN